MRINVQHDGKVYNGLPEELAAIGIPQTLIDEAMAREQSAAKKLRIRERIHSSIGDAESLLGTTADAVQILLYHVGKLADSLSAANSLAEVRAAASDLKALLGGFVNDVDSGVVELPYKVKGGETAIMPEIRDRADKVAKLLE